MNDSMAKESPGSVGPAQRATVLRIRAVGAQAAGHADSAVAMLRMAADSVALDPALYLAEGPQRSSVGVTHLLLARALADGGHPAEARRAYAHWKNADPDLPDLAEARAGAAGGSGHASR